MVLLFVLTFNTRIKSVIVYTFAKFTSIFFLMKHQILTRMSEISNLISKGAANVKSLSIPALCVYVASHTDSFLYRICLYRIMLGSFNSVLFKSYLLSRFTSNKGLFNATYFVTSVCNIHTLKQFPFFLDCWRSWTMNECWNLNKWKKKKTLSIYQHHIVFVCSYDGMFTLP